MRVILREPEVVLIDEKAIGNDSLINELLEDFVFELINSKTVIVLKNNYKKLEKFSRIGLIESGKIVEIGALNELQMQ